MMTQGEPTHRGRVNALEHLAQHGGHQGSGGAGPAPPQGAAVEAAGVQQPPGALCVRTYAVHLVRQAVHETSSTYSRQYSKTGSTS